MSISCSVNGYQFKLQLGLLLMLLLIACSGGAAWAGATDYAPAPSASSSLIKDDDQSSPSTIRKNYFKRFPYAKEANRKDIVQNGESQAGTTESYKAYSKVQKLCDGENMDKEYDCVHEGWDALCGKFFQKVEPHIFYKQDEQTATVSLATQRDSEALKFNLVKTYGLPMSDTQFQIIDRNNKQRLLELFYDPERWMWSELSTGQMQSSFMANSLGGAAQNTFKQAVKSINKVLINVANESSTSSGSDGSADGAAIQRGVKIVLKAYKEIFLPIGLLLLLPGTILSQLKTMVSVGFFGKDEEEARSPFDGIIRAVIAIFLIPATQLFVSYSIDIGNILAEEVKSGWVNQTTIIDWSNKQTYVPQLTNNAIPINESSGQNSGGGGQQGSGGSGGNGGGNSGGGGGAIFNLNLFGNSGLGQFGNQWINNFLTGLFGQGFDFGNRFFEFAFGEGKQAGQPQESSHQENQLFLSTTLQIGSNGIAYLLGYGLTVLTAYQLVFMCYLLLMGPIAASFFAWPSGFGKLFRKVFTNWVDAVVVLSLWRFYWCVILACMTQRIVYLQQTGGYNPNSPLEAIVFDCFLALLMYVPFQPFNFNPGEAASAVLEKAQQGGAGGGAGGAAPGGAVPGVPGQGGHEKAMSMQRSGFATIEFTKLSSGHNSGLQISEHGGGEREGGHGLPANLIVGAGGGPGPGRGDHTPSSPPVNLGEKAVHVSSHAAALPPPLAAQSLALSLELRNLMGIAQIESIPQSSPPTVALAPPAGMGGSGKYLINTSNMDHARAGMQAWQQVNAGTTGGGAPATGGSAPAAGGGPAQGAATPGAASTGAPPGAAQSATAPAGSGSPSGSPAAGTGDAGQSKAGPIQGSQGGESPGGSKSGGSKPPGSGDGASPPKGIDGGAAPPMPPPPPSGS